VKVRKNELIASVLLRLNFRTEQYPSNIQIFDGAILLHEGLLSQVI